MEVNDVFLQVNLDSGSTREGAFKPSEVRRDTMLIKRCADEDDKRVSWLTVVICINSDEDRHHMSVAIVAVDIQDTRIHDIGSNYNMSMIINMMDTSDSGWPSRWWSRPGRWVVWGHPADLHNHICLGFDP